MRSVAVVFFALALAVGLAVVVADGEASGQGTGTFIDPVAEEFRLSREEWRVINNSAFRTASPEQTEAARAKRAWSCSLPKAAPRLAPHLMKAGLIGVASGVWLHNALVIEAALSDAEVVRGSFDGEFAVEDPNAVFRGGNLDDPEGAVSFVSRIEYTVSGTEGTLTIRNMHASTTPTRPSRGWARASAPQGSAEREALWGPVVGIRAEGNASRRGCPYGID